MACAARVALTAAALAVLLSTQGGAWAGGAASPGARDGGSAAGDVAMHGGPGIAAIVASGDRAWEAARGGDAEAAAEVAAMLAGWELEDASRAAAGLPGEAQGSPAAALAGLGGLGSGAPNYAFFLVGLAHRLGTTEAARLVDDPRGVVGSWAPGTGGGPAGDALPAVAPPGAAPGLPPAPTPAPGEGLAGGLAGLAATVAFGLVSDGPNDARQCFHWAGSAVAGFAADRAGLVDARGAWVIAWAACMAALRG